VHVPSDEKNGDSRDSFYEDLEQVFKNFPTYHTKMLLGYLNAKLGREIIFIPTLGMRVYIRIVMILVLKL